MKHRFTKSFIITFFMSLLSSFPIYSETGIESQLNEARAVTQALGSQLKQRLTKAVKEGGPKAAVSICHTEAPLITEAVSNQHEWEIGRTSLKTRNPNNAPDAWERRVLQDFEARLLAGKALATLEYIETTNEGIRYMKAIPTTGVCLTCHGNDIQPELKAELQRLYPDDKATGFSIGEIRGAFTLINAN